MDNEIHNSELFFFSNSTANKKMVIYVASITLGT